MRLPPWMRVTLWATSLMNMLGALAFIPQFGLIRELLALPSATHPLYLWIIGEFIFLFGMAYGWCAQKGHAPRILIGLGAAGKLAFTVTMTGFWLTGDLSIRAVLSSFGDLAFAILFLIWLVQTQKPSNEGIT